MYKRLVSPVAPVDFGGGGGIAAMISLDSLAAMGLVPGTPVWVCFKASDVVLAGQD